MVLTLERKSHPALDHLCVCFFFRPVPIITEEVGSVGQVRNYINFTTPQSPGNAGARSSIQDVPARPLPSPAPPGACSRLSGWQWILEGKERLAGGKGPGRGLSIVLVHFRPHPLGL